MSSSARTRETGLASPQPNERQPNGQAAAVGDTVILEPPTLIEIDEWQEVSELLDSHQSGKRLKVRMHCEFRCDQLPGNDETVIGHWADKSG